MKRDIYWISRQLDCHKKKKIKHSIALSIVVLKWGKQNLMIDHHCIPRNDGKSENTYLLMRSSQRNQPHLFAKHAWTGKRATNVDETQQVTMFLHFFLAERPPLSPGCTSYLPFARWWGMAAVSETNGSGGAVSCWVEAPSSSSARTKYNQNTTKFNLKQLKCLKVLQPKYIEVQLNTIEIQAKYNHAEWTHLWVLTPALWVLLGGMQIMF